MFFFGPMTVNPRTRRIPQFLTLEANVHGLNLQTHSHARQEPVAPAKWDSNSWPHYCCLNSYALDYKSQHPSGLGGHLPKTHLSVSIVLEASGFKYTQHCACFSSNEIKSMVLPGTRTRLCFWCSSTITSVIMGFRTMKKVCSQTLDSLNG